MASITKDGDFFLGISRGNVIGTTSEFKFARSSLISTTESVVWDGGGDYTWITTAEKLSIVSTSTNDTGAGTGARTLLVAGLDSDYNVQSEVLTLTGTTPVITELLYIRVYRALVVTSGTDSAAADANDGIITITGDSSSTVLARILAGNGQTLMSTYTVPAGKTAYITGATFSAGEGKQCTFKAKIRNGPQTDNGAFSVKYVIDVFESSFFASFKIPLAVPEKTDACFTALTTAGTIDASVSYGLILIGN